MRGGESEEGTTGQVQKKAGLGRKGEERSEEKAWDWIIFPFHAKELLRST